MASVALLPRHDSSVPQAAGFRTSTASGGSPSFSGAGEATSLALFHPASDSTSFRKRNRFSASSWRTTSMTSEVTASSSAGADVRGSAVVLLVQGLLEAIQDGAEVVEEGLGHAVADEQVAVGSPDVGRDAGPGEKPLVAGVHVRPKDAAASSGSS